MIEETSLPVGDCSIVVPVHNRPEKLARALASAVLQGDEVREIIAVDDASSPENAQAIARIVAHTPRARLLRQDANTGAARARNNGVAASSGSWIAFLDSDDWWLPGRLAAHRGALSRPGVAASYNPAYITRGGADDAHGLSGRKPPDGLRFAAALAGWNFVGGCSFVCVRRSAFDAVGGFDPEMPSCQDWDLWLRLSLHGQFAFLPEPQGFFDVGPHQRISTSNTSVMAGHERMHAKALATDLNPAERRHARASQLWTDADIARRFNRLGEMLRLMGRSLATRPTRRSLKGLPILLLSIPRAIIRGGPPLARIYLSLGGAYDLGVLRIGGPGLGNQLLNWARALVLAERIGGILIDPAWPSLKLGPMLRGERDQRRYGSYFRHGVIGARGLRKWRLLLGARALERYVDPTKVLPPQGRPTLYVNRSDDIAPVYFEGLWDHQPLVCAELPRIIEPRELDRVRALEAPHVAVHVRFGDFKSVPTLGEAIVNTRLPLEWYVDRVGAIRRATDGRARFVIFSDASDEELGALLAASDVRRQQGENALIDMLAMARASILVCSASTFSMWAAFIGRMPSLWHPGAMPGAIPPTHSSAFVSAMGEPLDAGFVAALDHGAASSFEHLLIEDGPK